MIEISTVDNRNYLYPGNGQAVDINTGELVETETKEIPIGSRITTPAQREQYKEFLKQEEKRKLRQAALKELGDFYFLLVNDVFIDVSPESAVRLTVLYTFLNYDGDLMLTQRQPMRKSDIAEVLHLSKATVFRFWKEVSPRYIEEVDNKLVLKDNIAFRGRFTKEHKFKQHQQIYIDGVRSLYYATKSRRHKYLGNIFKLLPFINFEYNIICKNPFETNADKIEPLTISELCNEFSFEVSNFHRLIDAYYSITFEVDDHKERFTAFIYEGKDKSKMKVYVNPHILYVGSDYRKVEGLGISFKELNQQNDSSFVKSAKTVKNEP